MDDVDFKDDTQLTPDSEKCELRVEGMTCGACVEVCDLQGCFFIY